ncbi:MAG: helix-turn-helix transcriptional regulator [Bacteriovoracaceae bacterium]|nr:helix-turn-helix transcriptional regulator [Bacteriovoracaceae bacterium]
MKLRNNIKLARVKAGNFTQQKLAQLVGCSRQTINSIESGKFNPSIELVLKLAKALDTQVEELFFLDHQKRE